MDDNEVIVEFPIDMVEEIEAIIAETGESFSDFVNWIVTMALEELDGGT